MAIRFTKKFLTRIDLFTISDAIMFRVKRGFDYVECEEFWPNLHLYNYTAKREIAKIVKLYSFLLLSFAQRKIISWHKPHKAQHLKTEH